MSRPVIMIIVIIITIIIIILTSVLVAGFPSRWSGLDPRPHHVGFVLDRVTLGQVLSGYFGLPCKFSFHQLLHIH
jgi:hypothetical protein